MFSEEEKNLLISLLSESNNPVKDSIISKIEQDRPEFEADSCEECTCSDRCNCSCDCGDIKDSMNTRFDSVDNALSELIDKVEDSSYIDEFTIKTHNMEKAKLFTNIENLVNALLDLKNWRREIYKGYDLNDTMYMTEGYKYEGLEKKIPIDIKKPEYSVDEDAKPSMAVKSDDYILRRIDEIFDENDVWRIIADL